MTDNFGNKYSPATTTRVIVGARISTIPIGTKFWVLTEVADGRGGYTKPDTSRFYCNCKGLEVSSVWLDEFELDNSSE